MKNVVTKPPEPSHRKRTHERSITVNLTLPPVLFDEAEKLVKSGGYNGLSGLFQACIRTNAGVGAIRANDRAA